MSVSRVRIVPIGLGVTPLLLVGACFGGNMVCTDEAVSSFSVEIRDSVSGAGLADQAVTKVIDGAFSDSLDVVDSVYQSGGVYERAGTYDVTITSTGYQTWAKQGVAVLDGGCHVRTARLLARLKPE